MTLLSAPRVFVISPFGGFFDAVFEYGLKPWFVSRDANVLIQRADTYGQLTEEIIQSIHNQIAQADIIVADTTPYSPNVMYEIGYADALGKRIIYICQDLESIPFDIRGRPHLQYPSIEDLKTQLTAKHGDLFRRETARYLGEFWRDILPSGAVLVKPVLPRKVAEDRYSWLIAEYDESACDRIWKYLAGLLPRSMVAGGRLDTVTTRYPTDPGQTGVEYSIMPKLQKGKNYVLVAGTAGNALAEVTLSRLLDLKAFEMRSPSDRKGVSFVDWRRPNMRSCIYDPPEENGWNGIRICGTESRVNYTDDYSACAAVIKISNGAKASIIMLLGLSGFGTYTAAITVTGGVDFIDSVESVSKFREFNHQYDRCVSGEIRCAVMLIESRGVRGFEFEELPRICSVHGYP